MDGGLNFALFDKRRDLDYNSFFFLRRCFPSQRETFFSTLVAFSLCRDLSSLIVLRGFFGVGLCDPVAGASNLALLFHHPPVQCCRATLAGVLPTESSKSKPPRNALLYGCTTYHRRKLAANRASCWPERNPIGSQGRFRKQPLGDCSFSFFSRGPGERETDCLCGAKSAGSMDLVWIPTESQSLDLGPGELTYVPTIVVLWYPRLHLPVRHMSEEPSLGHGRIEVASQEMIDTARPKCRCPGLDIYYGRP